MDMKSAKNEEKTKKPAPKKAVKKAAPKKAIIAKVVKEAPAIARMEAGSYIPAVGRRKTAIARVRLIKNGKGVILINERPYKEYFPVFQFQQVIMQPLLSAGQSDSVDVSVHVSGGGLRGQSEATRLGISRALLVLNPTFRKTLKKEGYLTRDARKKERKKPGLKKARRAPQWSKR